MRNNPIFLLHFNIYNMATFKVLLHSSNRRKDGTYPVSLRIIKNMKAKYISLGLYSKKEEWDVIGERFRCVTCCFVVDYQLL